MTELGPSEPQDVFFTIDSLLLPRLHAWQRLVDERCAKEQVRTGCYSDGAPLREDTVRSVRLSLERGEPQPYHGASGGAYSFCFTPTSLGCVVKVRHTGGEQLDLTDYDSW